MDRPLRREGVCLCEFGPREHSFDWEFFNSELYFSLHMHVVQDLVGRYAANTGAGTAPPGLVSAPSHQPPGGRWKGEGGFGTSSARKRAGLHLQSSTPLVDVGQGQKVNGLWDRKLCKGQGWSAPPVIDPLVDVGQEPKVRGGWHKQCEEEGWSAPPVINPLVAVGQGQKVRGGWQRRGGGRGSSAKGEGWSVPRVIDPLVDVGQGPKVRVGWDRKGRGSRKQCEGEGWSAPLEINPLMDVGQGPKAREEREKGGGRGGSAKYRDGLPCPVSTRGGMVIVAQLPVASWGTQPQGGERTGTGGGSLKGASADLILMLIPDPLVVNPVAPGGGCGALLSAVNRQLCIECFDELHDWHRRNGLGE